MAYRSLPPDTYRSWREARRDIARRHHPDVGGDPARYIQLMREVDVRFGIDALRGTPDGQSETRLVGGLRRAGRAVRRARRRTRHGLRRARGRLPRRFPGSRRYIDL